VAIALAHASTGGAATVTTATATLSATAAAGNTMTVTVGVQTGAGVTISSVTDSASNTYVARGAFFQAGASTLVALYDCLVLVGAPTTVTVNISASSSIRILANEWTGIGSFDTIAGLGNATSLTPTPPVITPAGAELVITGISIGSGAATCSQSTSGFTTQGPVVQTGTTYDAYNVNTTTGTVQWTISSTNTSGQYIAGYLPVLYDRTIPSSVARRRAANW
jgi:hypothetical protein